MTIHISPNTSGTPVGKLADVELRFDDGPLAGLRLIGFAIWERRTREGRNVTFPARQYTVNGERRSFALLRPLDLGGLTATQALVDVILAAYADFERQVV